MFSALFHDPPLPAPPHVSLWREARIAVPQAGFPFFFRSERRIPGPLWPSTPRSHPFLSHDLPRPSPSPPTLPPQTPPRDRSRLGPRPSQLPSPGCWGLAGQPNLAREGMRRARERARASLYKKPALLDFWGRARAAQAGRAGPSSRTSALSALVSTRSGRGRGGTWLGVRSFFIGPNGTARAGQLAN